MKAVIVLREKKKEAATTSQYSLTSQAEDFIPVTPDRTSVMSLIYRRRRIGPRMEP